MKIAGSWLWALPATALAASLAWIAPASSQSAPEPPGAGNTSMAQFVARQTERIMAADTDGDGRISRAEMAATADKAGRDPSRRFDAMDTNHDGYLDKGEIRAALEQRFHRLDSNGDGILTPEERMAARRDHRPPDPASTPAAAQP